MGKLTNKLNLKIPTFLRWILFIPVTLIIYKIITFVVYLGVTFLFHFLGTLHWYLLIIILFPAVILLIIIAGGIWACFYLGLSLSPNKLLCWLLSAWLIFSAISTIHGYYSPIPQQGIDISMPCWAYVILQAYIIISLIMAAIVSGKNISNREDNKNQVK